MEQLKCKICGTTRGSDMNPENYSESNIKELMKNEGICFSCAFWKIKAKEYNPNVFIYEQDGKLLRTTTSKLLINPFLNKGFIGSNGTTFYIQMLETEETFETNNLWFQGIIPKHFKNEEGLQKNCRLLSFEEYVSILQKQGKGKTLFAKDYEHIGQVLIENSLSEVNRLNREEKDAETVWRIDFSEELIELNPICEESILKLEKGNCWITSVKQYAIVSEDYRTLYKGDRNLIYTNFEFIKTMIKNLYKDKVNIENLSVTKNQSDLEKKISTNLKD